MELELNQNAHPREHNKSRIQKEIFNQALNDEARPFADSDEADRSKSLSSRRNSKNRERLLNQVFQQYLAEKSNSGELLAVAAYDRGYAPDREMIGTEIYQRFGVHVQLYHLYPEWFVREINERVAAQLKKQGKSKPTLEEKKSTRAADKKRQRCYADVLEKWLRKLKKSGRKLKINKSGTGTDHIWISEQSGIPYAHLLKSSTQCYQLIKKARTEIGLEKFLTVDDFIRGEYTYHQLLDYGTECRRAELEGKKNAVAQLANTRFALRKFCRSRGLALETKIGAELGVLFDASRQEFAASLSNGNSKKKLLSELGKWEGYYASLIGTGDLPADFPSALKFLIEASGCTYVEIERLYVPNKKQRFGVVGNWVRGSSRPSLKFLPLIRKMEEFFKLPPDTLTGRISFNPQSGVQAALRKGGFSRPPGGKYAVLAELLPNNFPALPVDEQRSLVAAANQHLKQNTSEYRNRQRSLQLEPSYWLGEDDYPSALNTEIEKLIDFKTASLPPSGYKRNTSAVWKKPDPEPRGSIGIFRAMLRSVFGVLTTAREKHGGGVRLEQLTLTQLILPGTWRLFLEYMERRQGFLPVSTAAQHLLRVSSLISRKFGWISQSPWLAERLEPLPGILTEQDVAQAKSDWNGFLRRIEPELRELMAQVVALDKAAPRSRDSHLPILPILESDAPLEIMREALEQYEQKIPNLHLAPTEAALGLRNIILLRILTETALRRHNIVSLTWNLDNTGQLFRAKNGHYEIEIPHTLFKNSQSGFFGPPRAKYPYRVKLSKKLTTLIDEYLLDARAHLVKQWNVAERKNSHRDGGFFFVSSSHGKRQGLSGDAGALVVRNFSRIHLVYNPLTGTGIKGVECFGMHAVRHIVATHILKKTGSFADAGAAIQDSEITARRHYARYLPSDRDKRFRSLITSLMENDAE
ncbi:MAG TPA: hypothetical protein VF599_17350 [Pyrinomonadaceae bacterium]|jgi:integrase